MKLDRELKSGYFATAVGRIEKILTRTDIRLVYIWNAPAEFLWNINCVDAALTQSMHSKRKRIASINTQHELCIVKKKETE